MLIIMKPGGTASKILVEILLSYFEKKTNDYNLVNFGIVPERAQYETHRLGCVRLPTKLLALPVALS